MIAAINKAPTSRGGLGMGTSRKTPSGTDKKYYQKSNRHLGHSVKIN